MTMITAMVMMMLMMMMLCAGNEKRRAAETNSMPKDVTDPIASVSLVINPDR